MVVRHLKSLELQRQCLMTGFGKNVSRNLSLCLNISQLITVLFVYFPQLNHPPPPLACLLESLDVLVDPKDSYSLSAIPPEPPDVTLSPSFSSLFTMKLLVSINLSTQLERQVSVFRSSFWPGVPMHSSQHWSVNEWTSCWKRCFCVSASIKRCMCASTCGWAIFLCYVIKECHSEYTKWWNLSHRQLLARRLSIDLDLGSDDGSRRNGTSLSRIYKLKRRYSHFLGFIF